MNVAEAIRLLDPETTRDAIAEIEYYNGFSGRDTAIKAVEAACVLAVEALKIQMPEETPEATEPLSDRQIEIIIAMAECNMHPYGVGRKLYLHPNTVLYHLEEIKRKTGLDPSNFFDLIKLFRIYGEAKK